jgi:hypothetical protein
MGLNTPVSKLALVGCCGRAYNCFVWAIHLYCLGFGSLVTEALEYSSSVVCLKEHFESEPVGVNWLWVVGWIRQLLFSSLILEVRLMKMRSETTLFSSTSFLMVREFVWKDFNCLLFWLIIVERSEHLNLSHRFPDIWSGFHPLSAALPVIGNTT